MSHRYKESMSKKWSTFLIIAVIIFILAGIIIGSNRQKQLGSSDLVEPSHETTELPSQDQVVLYYGNTCPHCKELEAWMEAEKIEEKISDKVRLQKKEVYQNQSNANELQNVAQSCGTAANGIGVPFLYAQGKCLTGTDQIEAYFQTLLQAAPSASRSGESSPSVQVTQGAAND